MDMSEQYSNLISGNINQNAYSLDPSERVVKYTGDSSSVMNNDSVKSIRIVYLNVRGLTDHKLNVLKDSMDGNTIMFLSETWYINMDKRKQDPLIVTCTSTSKVNIPGRRQDHGMIMMALPCMNSRIKILNIREFLIHVTVNGISIAAVYLPPSMSVKNIQSELSCIQSVNILIGDVNARYGSLNNDTASGPVDRVNSIATFINRFDLVFKRSTNDSVHSRVDHVFIEQRMNEQSTLRILDAIVNTDHPMLELNIDSESEYPCDTVRYRINLLNHKVNEYLFNEQVMHECNVLIDYVKHYMECNSDGESITELIEFLDACLMNVISASLENTVGVYNPLIVKSHRRMDDSMNHSITDTVKCFARSQRIQKKELLSNNSNESVMQNVINHYSSLYTPMDIQWSDIENVQVNYTEVDNPFNCISVCNAIRNYSNGKSPGLDGIDCRVLKSLLNNGSFIECTAFLFSLCYSYGYTPRRWNVSVIHSIPKSNDFEYITDRRPISLTVIFRRIFEKILLKHIHPWIELNDGQAGFRSGYSCMTHVLLANEGKTNGMKHSVFIDLKNAYDKVNIDRLVYKLYKKNIPYCIVRLIASLFYECQSTVVVNRVLSQLIPRHCGLFQGSILSPILFNVYIDDLADMINRENSMIPKCILFADDILLQSRTEHEMNEHLSILNTWCNDNGMIVNVIKCGTFSKNDFRLNNDSNSVNDSIPIVKTYKYLGCIFDKNGLNMKLHVNRCIEKANRLLSFLRMNINTMSWSEIVKLNIYKICIRPIIEYGASLVLPSIKQDRVTKRGKRRKLNRNVNLLKLLDNAQKNALTWIFECKRNSNILSSLCSLPNMNIRMDELTTRFLMHMNKMDNDNPLRRVIDSKKYSALIGNILSHKNENDILTSTRIRKRYLNMTIEYYNKFKLSKYIDNTCRNKNGIDNCLFIENPKLRRRAIQWRRNAFGHFDKCRKCNEYFTRSHIVKCNMLESMELKQDIVDEWRDKSLEYNDGHYTILDHLLNKRLYEDFERCLKTIEMNTYRSPVAHNS